MYGREEVRGIERSERFAIDPKKESSAASGAASRCPDTPRRWSRHSAKTLK